MSKATPALRLDAVSKRYREGGGDGHLTVLREVSLKLHPGQLTALVGPSGSGKSTLLHIAGLLDQPDKGEVWIAGKRCGKLDEAGRTLLRRVAVGFVYQFHHLLPEFTALENVAIPRRVAGASRKEAEARAHELLERMGLAGRVHHRPAELSGGEQQRVAISRAVANNPLVLLADEPTGNLDPETSEKVFQELTALARRQGLAALIATHNLELAGRMDRVLRMSGGRLVEA